ncbi:MAG: response regulator [Dehalococcoidia bacterium]
MPDAGGEPSTGAPPSILVVEDELHLRRMMRRLLEREGYRVYDAPDGLAALEAVETDPPDVIILDYKMPVLDGGGFLAERRRRGIPETPVILVSASPEARDLSERFGCDGLLTKPFGAQVLLAAVARTLDRLQRPLDGPGG